MVFLKERLKKLILKNRQRTKKNAKLPSRQRFFFIANDLTLSYALIRYDGMLYFCSFVFYSDYLMALLPVETGIEMSICFWSVSIMCHLINPTPSLKLQQPAQHKISLRR